jgi:hypothetical protein
MLRIVHQRDHDWSHLVMQRDSPCDGGNHLLAVLAIFLGICACQYKQTVRFEATPPRREYWREILARNRERALQRAAHRRAARRGTTVDFELANFDSWSVGNGGSGGS